MMKLTEIPMRTLEDVLAWHDAQVMRYTNLKVRYLADPELSQRLTMLKYKLKSVEPRLDFHQSVVDVMKANLKNQAPSTMP